MNNFNKIWLYIIIFPGFFFAQKISEPHAARRGIEHATFCMHDLR